MSRAATAGTDWYSAPVYDTASVSSGTAPRLLEFPTPPPADSVVTVVLAGRTQMVGVVTGLGATWERVRVDGTSSGNYPHGEVWVGRNPNGVDSVVTIAFTHSTSYIYQSLARWFRHSTGVVSSGGTDNVLTGSARNTLATVGTGFDLHLHFMTLNDSPAGSLVDAIRTRTRTPDAELWMLDLRESATYNSGAALNVMAVDWLFSAGPVSGQITRGADTSTYLVSASMVLQMEPSRFALPPMNAVGSMELTLRGDDEVPRDWRSPTTYALDVVEANLSRVTPFSCWSPPPVGSKVIVVLGLSASKVAAITGGTGVTWTRVTSETNYNTIYGDLEVWEGVGFNGTDNEFAVQIPATSDVSRITVYSRWLRFIDAPPVSNTLTSSTASTRTSTLPASFGRGLHLHVASYTAVSTAVSDFRGTQIGAAFTPNNTRWMKALYKGPPYGTSTVMRWYETNFYPATESEGSLVTYTELAGEDPAQIIRNLYWPMPGSMRFDFVGTSSMTWRFAPEPVELEFAGTADLDIFTTIAQSVFLGPLTYDAVAAMNLAVVVTTVVDLDPLDFVGTATMDLDVDVSYVWQLTFVGTSGGEIEAVVGVRLGETLVFAGTSDMVLPEVFANSINIVLIFGPGGDLPTSGVPAPSEPDPEVLELLP